MPTLRESSSELVDVEDLSFRADVKPSSWDEEDNSVEVVWTAGADVLRMDWKTGVRYWERLDCAPGSVDLSRLQSGKAPVLDAHDDWSNRSVVGVVKANSVTLDPSSRIGSARLRFTRAVDAVPVVSRVKEGVINSFSFGYSRTRIEQTAETRDGFPVWVVRAWQPYEISPVPIPADTGTGTRGVKPHSTTRCEIVRSSPNMPPEILPTQAEIDAADAKRKAESLAAEKAAREAGAKAERERAAAVDAVLRKAKLDPETEAQLRTKFTADGTTVDAAREAVLDAIAARDDKTKTDTTHRADVGQSDDDKLRSEFADALIRRNTATKRSGVEGDLCKAFRGMTAPRMAEFFLRRSGVRTELLGHVEIARRAMSTSDFPQALANVLGKTLRSSYVEAPKTFEAFVRRTTLNDFKPASRVGMSGAPGLQKVVEGASLPNGTIADIAQGIRLFKYGTVLPVTWETIVNDDLDAIVKNGLMFGASLAALEGDLVYSLITGNQIMDETGLAMIHATHGNTMTGAMSVANLSIARGKIRKQVGPAPVSRPLNLEGRLILVGPDLEIEAAKFIAEISPEQAANANPLRGKIQGVVADTRLEATKWRLAATPDQIDTIELANLAGVEDLMIDEQVDFRTKSLETSALAHRGAAAIDYRWIVESTGS